MIGLTAAVARHQEKAGTLRDAVRHFLKVTRSYWSGLFHCYDTPGLPRTNNDLEHYFGECRYNERRATGRKQASPSLVVRGSVRIIASVATRHRTMSAADIRPRKTDEWVRLRSDLEGKREVRRAQLRFRRDPHAYLAKLEDELLKLALPA